MCWGLLFSPLLLLSQWICHPKKEVYFFFSFNSLNSFWLLICCAMELNDTKVVYNSMGCPLCCESQPTLRNCVCCWRWFGYWNRRLTHITYMFLLSVALSLTVTYRCLWVCLCLLLSLSVYLPIDRSFAWCWLASLRVFQSNNAWLSSLNCF